MSDKPESSKMLDEMRAKVALLAKQREEQAAAFEEERSALLALLDALTPLIRAAARSDRPGLIAARLRRLADDIEGKP